MRNDLRPKELLFCTYYAQCRNGREAAARSGYHAPERAAQKLLQKQAVRAQIAADRHAAAKKEDIIAGYTRLAFGCVSDAIRLLQCDELPEDLDTMDLFLISEIKRPKSGGMEIKFFDRLKALEKLETLVCADETAAASSLFAAIAQGAAALQKEDAHE